MNMNDSNKYLNAAPSPSLNLNSSNNASLIHNPLTPLTPHTPTMGSTPLNLNLGSLSSSGAFAQSPVWSGSYTGGTTPLAYSNYPMGAPISSPRFFPGQVASTPTPTSEHDSSHPSGIKPTLQNIVSTVNLGCELDLRSIAEKARNAEYNPKRFAAVIMRIKDPKTTALIFHSGKMVCTGAKSEEQSRLAARKYARIILKLGFSNVKFSDFKIQNIVGSCDVRFPIKLEGLNLAHSRYSSYEPELFPGLIYRMHKPKIVLLIFVSGKIVLTGAKDRNEIYEAFEHIYPVLTEFRKTSTGAKE